jgi:hypothetical protein
MHKNILHQEYDYIDVITTALDTKQMIECRRAGIAIGEQGCLRV